MFIICVLFISIILLFLYSLNKKNKLIEENNNELDFNISKLKDKNINVDLLACLLLAQNNFNINNKEINALEDFKNMNIDINNMNMDMNQNMLNDINNPCSLVYQDQLTINNMNDFGSNF